MKFGREQRSIERQKRKHDREIMLQIRANDQDLHNYDPSDEEYDWLLDANEKLVDQLYYEENKKNARKLTDTDSGVIKKAVALGSLMVVVYVIDRHSAVLSSSFGKIVTNVVTKFFK